MQEKIDDSSKLILKSYRDTLLFWGVLIFTCIIGLIELLQHIDPALPTVQHFLFGVIYVGLLFGMGFSIYRALGIYRDIRQLALSGDLGEKIRITAKEKRTLIDRFIDCTGSTVVEKLAILAAIVVFGSLYLTKVIGAQSDIPISVGVLALGDLSQSILLACNVVGTFTTAVLLIYTIRQLRAMSSQNWILIYSDYTKRYAEIIKNFPENINEPDFAYNKLGPEKRDKTMRMMRLYFDLCYEEHSMYYKYRKIEKDVWMDWKEGIEATVRNKAFRVAWKKIQKDTFYPKTGDFNRFIEAAMTEVTNQNNTSVARVV